MITPAQLYNVNYYKKAVFTGSQKKMHFRILRTEGESGASFLVETWPGPYNYETTPDEKKKSASFPFTNEALTDIADYLNHSAAAYNER
jgi:hypothetical protein